METFKPGDTVRLKSGGPLMTVSAVKDDKVWCDWFVNNEQKSGNFPITSITLEDEDDNDNDEDDDDDDEDDDDQDDDEDGAR